MAEIGGPVNLVEARGNIELCSYGSARYPGWAIFIHKPGKSEPSVINGRYDDVMKKYLDLIRDM